MSVKYQPSRQLFDIMRQRKLVTWNSMLKPTLTPVILNAQNVATYMWVFDFLGFFLDHMCVFALGVPGDAQRLDSIVGPPTKRFMLHYSFPPFCINEVGKRTGLNHREVGHGTLAEKALLVVLPPELDFPYTVRINSGVMGSDGSTSMATVCGGSMALMDAGIPLRDQVAGLSVGLVTEVDSSTGNVEEYRILTDILGLEDHLGDIDFKIARTRNGITAIQLDIKPVGIPLDIICESLGPAYKGRLQILDHMEQEINAARTQDGRNSPRIVTLKYSNDDLRRLIGPLGALKMKIEEETGMDIVKMDKYRDKKINRARDLEEN